MPIVTVLLRAQFIALVEDALMEASVLRTYDRITILHFFPQCFEDKSLTGRRFSSPTRMNTVPLLFAEDVARLLKEASLCSLKDLRSGHFRDVGRSLWAKQICIDVNVVFNPEAGTFDYCLTCRRGIKGVFGAKEAYTYDPADSRKVFEFRVYLLEDKSYVNRNVQWTTATRTDPTFLNWLRAKFARTELHLHYSCPEFLKLLPSYCTFNEIHGDDAYDDEIDAIIQRSQVCGRLETLLCKEFFKKRGREASAEWILINNRLKNVSGCNVSNRAGIEDALTEILSD